MLCHTIILWSGVGGLCTLKPFYYWEWLVGHHHANKCELTEAPLCLVCDYIFNKFFQSPTAIWPHSKIFTVQSYIKNLFIHYIWQRKCSYQHCSVCPWCVRWGHYTQDAAWNRSGTQNAKPEQQMRNIFNKVSIRWTCRKVWNFQFLGTLWDSSKVWFGQEAGVWLELGLVRLARPANYPFNPVQTTCATISI